MKNKTKTKALTNGVEDLTAILTGHKIVRVGGTYIAISGDGDVYAGIGLTSLIRKLEVEDAIHTAPIRRDVIDGALKDASRIDFLQMIAPAGDRFSIGTGTLWTLREGDYATAREAIDSAMSDTQRIEVAVLPPLKGGRDED